jgi:Ca2+-binding RTX toxin-like protein
VSERIRRPVALFVVSVLLVALSAGAALAANVNGTSGNDIIGPDPFNGVSLQGNDTIRALQGNDTVDGVTGDDDIFGDQGEDNLIGAEHSDTVDGGNGKDIIDLAQFDTDGSHDEGLGGNGDDPVQAKDGNHDVIDCGNGKDTVFYDQGIDSITKCEVLNS